MPAQKNRFIVTFPNGFSFRGNSFRLVVGPEEIWKLLASYRSTLPFFFPFLAASKLF